MIWLLQKDNHQILAQYRASWKSLNPALSRRTLRLISQLFSVPKLHANGEENTDGIILYRFGLDCFSI
jgi:hypothetical protein